MEQCFIIKGVSDLRKKSNIYFNDGISIYIMQWFFNVNDWVIYGFLLYYYSEAIMNLSSD